MPSAPKKVVRRQTKLKSKAFSETEQLRHRLAEARLHRDLLIQTLHGLTVHGARPMKLSDIGVPPDINTVLQWLVDEIATLTSTRPILGASTLTDLRIPIPKLVTAIQDKWFPDGGGFQNVEGSTTVGNLAYAIAHPQ